MEAFIGGKVFFKCVKRSWIVGVLESFDTAKRTGTCKAVEGGDVVQNLKEEEIHPCRDGSEDEDVNDLLMLTELHDATLLHCVRQRYFKDIIYTNIGAIVVALNPFNFKIPRYLESMMPQYLAEGEIIEKSLPHSWACAHNTYYEMKNDSRNQTILVSGESGAGKTEASKIVMRYLGAVSCLRGKGQEKEAAELVATKINKSSPILEAFGNAKTVRNDNSSRFGKFMEVKFDREGFLVGAKITKYLLEKSRIITASQGERVYHSFYLLLRCSKRAEYLLEDDKKYKTVNAGRTLSNPEFDTEKEFEEVSAAMRTMGVSENEKNSIWKVLAGILHLENVEFIPDGEGSMLAASSTEAVGKATSLWEIDRAAYERELKETTLVIMGNPVKKLMNIAQSADARSALDKALYDATFTWLVDQCNKSLDVGDNYSNWIGLLDIFGFEDFKVNSFEQLCINLTNETLQHHYNTFIFCRDVEECRAEGVDMSGVPFPDNTPCLKMITGPGGVMALLDEECQLGSGTDQAFFEKVTQKWNGTPFFEVKKGARSSFTIKHYAGNVAYEVQDFREKNLDTLKDAWKHMVRASKDPFIAQLLPEPVDLKGPKPTVSGFFKKQLNDLMDLINSTNPHWIRCIKPHPAKKPLMFDGISVMSQLSSSGVLGTVRIRKAGYAVRLPVATFVAQYRIIAKAKGRDCTAKGILDACKYSKEDAQIGTKRVFLRSHIYLDIELRKKEALASSAEIIQSFASAANSTQRLRASVNRVHGNLIESLRTAAKKLVALQKSEIEVRAQLDTQFSSSWRQLMDLERNSVQEARAAERERMQAYLDALRAQQEAVRVDLMETEETFRMVFIREQAGEFGVIGMMKADDLQRALDLQARREHKEAESILMKERRIIREARREKELDRMLQQSARRLEPTLAREDRTLHAVQRQLKAKEESISEAQERAKKEEARRKEVERRQAEQKEIAARKIQESQFTRWKTQQAMAKSKIAYERYERIQREDFEWQRLEQQILHGQRLALEEQRRMFLQEKAEQDKKRRQAMKLDEEALLHQKWLEMQQERSAQEEEESKKQERTLQEERKIFNQLAEFREEIHRRERARAVEKSISWDADRRERMILQRPDIPKEAVDAIPLAKRVGPPAPFIMSNNLPSYAQIWTPFKVVKLDAAPRRGVVQGGKFTVSWCATKTTPSAYIVVTSGTGEVGRCRVKTAVGEWRFTAPDEWFSELEISFVSGDEVVKSTTIAKATI
jgi:myosin heavy subunit